jgi:UPF0755 protein
MRNRQPADRSGAPFSRPSAAVARSPAERLEPTRPPKRPRRHRFDEEERRASPLLRLLNGLFTFMLLLMLAIGGGAFLFDKQIEAAGPLEAQKVVAIPKNEGTHEIASRLEREGIVSDRRLFIAGYLWTKLEAWLQGGKSVQLRAGDYGIRQNASIRQVIEVLSEGRTISYKVTVPEGLTSHQIVERLNADPNLSGEIATVPPEGSLLPETFMVDRGASRQAIIERMQGEARKAIEKAWAQRKENLPLKSLEEAVVLASIVEKETGRADERERVAAVFVNRLKANMRLQSDPTILYGISGGKTVWNRPIHRSEINQKTQHNTYQIEGLPPTPICNPGRASIEAVLNPAETRDLFFVADGTGRHVFSETNKEHEANVRRWRAVEKDMKAKSGAPVSDTPTTANPPAEAEAKPKKGVLIRTAPPPATKDTAPEKKAPADAAKELPWANKPKS